MQREPSSYALLFSLPDSVLQPERVLWLHVVAQALIDASSRDKELRQEVAEWVDSEDFEVVCGMATLRIEHMRYAFKAILADNDMKRAFKRAMDFRFMVRSFVESHTGEIDKNRTP
jgi:hypothetical protein